MHTITRQDITALLPWMSLDGGPDGPDALAFSDSGRLLFIGVHDDTTAPDGGASDGILRYDTQTGDLTLFARLEIANQGTTWPHNALAFYKGVLYAGVDGGIKAYCANKNDLTGTLLFSSSAPAGFMVHGLTVDRGNVLLYATWNDQIYRSPVTGTSLNFTLVGGGFTNLRALAYSDNYGGPATPGLFVLESTASPAFARVWYINPSMARGLLTYNPSTYLVQLQPVARPVRSGNRRWKTPRRR